MLAVARPGLSLLLVAAACSEPVDASETTYVPADPPACGDVPARGFCDATAAVGLDRVHTAPAFDLPGGGVALADFDGDGDLDVYVTGISSPGAMYRNDGDQFADVTEAAGLAGVARAVGVGVADLDDDGDQDIVLTGKNERLRLYANAGDGTFVEMGEAAFGPGRFDANSVAIGDADGDGDLDVYVTTWQSSVAPTSAPELLFRNDGALTFVEQAGPRGAAGGDDTLALAAAFTDVDGDADLDLYVANDFGMVFAPNMDLRNDGTGTFEAVARGGDIEVFGMSVSPADYDNDGDIDIYVSSIGDNALLRNDGTGGLEDVAVEAGVSAYGYVDDDDEYRDALVFDADASDPRERALGEWSAAHLNPDRREHVTISWASLWLDYDHDGWLDLYVCNGFLGYVVGLEGRRQPNMLFRNRGDGGFDDVTAASGAGDRGDAQGCAVGDIDGDGDLDLVVANVGWDDDVTGARFAVLRNDAAAGHWLRLALEGTASNRDGIGAVVTVSTRDGTQLREVSGGDGYVSASARDPHFGLGANARVARVEIRWPSGTVDVLRDVDADQVVAIREGDHAGE